MTLTQISSRGVEDTLRWILGASGTDHYTFTGPGLTGTVNDPTIYLSRGQTYIFENNSGGHPFQIQSVAGSGGSAYNTGVTNNGGGNGAEIKITVPHDAPDNLYYQCTSHANMGGTIFITGAVAAGSITTAKLAADAVDATKLANNAVDETAIANGAVTINKLATNAVDNSKIGPQAVTLSRIINGTSSEDGKFLRANNGASPTFETIDLTALSASNLTSGTVPDARIAASSVTQHVTAYDDTNVRHDVSVLALHFADQNNKVAFDLANSTIDPMESNASISTATDAFFDASSEYWGTVSNSLIDFTTGITSFTHSGLVGVTQSIFMDDNVNNNAFHTDSSGVGSFFRVDLGAVKTVTAINIYTRSGTVTASWQIQGSNDDSSFTDTGYDINAGGGNGWHVVSLSSNNTWRYWKFYKTNGAAGGGYHAELELQGTPTNATGSIISNTYTAPSSRSVVSGVLLYRDVSGTATLGTDLKVFFSCDNGSTYTEAASYTPLNMAFKSGVKAATLGKTTCTAGTQIRYKVEWANQAANTKVTGCQGVALQY